MVQLVPCDRRYIFPGLVGAVIVVRRQNAVFRRTHSREIPAPGAEIAAGTEQAPRFLNHRVQPQQEIRMHPVVAVHEGQPLAAAVGLRPINARIPGGGKAAVFLMNDMDSTVFPGVFLADIAAAVRAAIVHQHKVKIRKRLGKDAVHAPVQERLHLIDRDNYADCGHRLPPFVSFSASEKALSACDRSSLPAVS